MHLLITGFVTVCDLPASEPSALGFLPSLKDLLNADKTASIRIAVVLIIFCLNSQLSLLLRNQLIVRILKKLVNEQKVYQLWNWFKEFNLLVLVQCLLIVNFSFVSGNVFQLSDISSWLLMIF